MRMILVATLLFHGLSTALLADDIQADTDKRAFDRARKASSVKTWDAAIAILEKIDIDKIDDGEVIEYVNFSL